MEKPIVTEQSMQSLLDNIRAWAHGLGFDHIGISDTNLAEHEAYLLNWLQSGMQGEMHYMHKHGTKRSRPDELLPGTVRIISVRMNYLPPDAQEPLSVLDDASLAYHKVMRNRLQKLANHIEQQVGPFGYRAFVDSAPVMEKALAHKAGLGWIGKHTNLLSEDAGSWFFLGELFTNLPLPIDQPSTSHCGTCQ